MSFITLKAVGRDITWRAGVPNGGTWTKFDVERRRRDIFHLIVVHVPGYILRLDIVAAVEQ